MLRLHRRRLYERLARAFTKNIFSRVFESDIISPTHKRTKGRAPVWGSDLITKVATLKRRYGRFHCWAEREILEFGGGALPPIEPNPYIESILAFENNFGSSQRTLLGNFDPAAWVDSNGTISARGNARHRLVRLRRGNARHRLKHFATRPHPGKTPHRYSVPQPQAA
jgi:hypothetical protein